MARACIDENPRSRRMESTPGAAAAADADAEAEEEEEEEEEGGEDAVAEGLLAREGGALAGGSIPPPSAPTSPKPCLRMPLDRLLSEFKGRPGPSPGRYTAADGSRGGSAPPIHALSTGTRGPDSAREARTRGRSLKLARTRWSLGLAGEEEEEEEEVAVEDTDPS